LEQQKEIPTELQREIPDHVFEQARIYKLDNIKFEMWLSVYWIVLKIVR